MENKTKTEAKKVSVAKIRRLNIDFVDFVIEARSLKITADKEKMIERYETYCGLAPSNIPRVASRVMRKELLPALKAHLAEKKVELKDFEAATEKVVEVMSERRNSNYQTIQV